MIRPRTSTDFNTQPFEPSYTLLVDPSRELTPDQAADVNNSSVVHKSVANVKNARPAPPAGKPEFVPPHSRPAPLAEAAADDDEGEGEDKGGEGEGVMKNARLATPDDGLLSVDELRRLFLDAEKAAGGRPKSLYQEASVLGGGKGLEGLTLGDRLTADELWLEIGRGEPCYTSFTPCVPLSAARFLPSLAVESSTLPLTRVLPLTRRYWHLTLDYIFLLPPATTGAYPRITAFLPPHSPETLGKGLPRTKISASDHVAVAGEIIVPA